jgi:hypothetical protein
MGLQLHAVQADIAQEASRALNCNLTIRRCLRKREGGGRGGGGGPRYHGDPEDREHVALLRHLESGPPGSKSNKAEQALECLATEVLGLGPAGAVVAGAMPWQERHARLWGSLLPFVLGDRRYAHADAQGWLARARMLPPLFPATHAAHPHHPLLSLASHGGAEGSQAAASPSMSPSPRITASLATPEQVTTSSEPEELVSFSGLASRQLPLIAKETESDASSACLSLSRDPPGSPVLGAWPPRPCSWRP